MYLVEGKNQSENHGIVHSFPRGKEIIAYALSDRIVTTIFHKQSIQFLTKHMIMLEPILMGYLAHFKKENFDFKLIGKMLTHMGTSLVSPNLQKKLTDLGLQNCA